MTQAGKPRRRYDCVVIGGGIAGMEAALTLGDMGFKILLVEKEPSIGGKMILLSKVFPTLDCSSCISTPKMAATQGHPNVTIFTSSSVDSIEPRGNGGFSVEITRGPTFVDPSRCTGCGQCEKVCPVARSDQFNDGLIARRAIYIPFPQAVPKKAVIERRGLSPCSDTCPAGVKVHGYIALLRNGRFERALERHMLDAPLMGTLGRVCYAPCEARCTKGAKTGTSVPIRALKKFMADRRHKGAGTWPYEAVEAEGARKRRVAVVGSGPSGLACAYYLSRLGVGVTVFEREQEPGGLLRYGIPAWRLPRDVVDRDIEEIKRAGAKIVTGEKIRSPRRLMENHGFEAVFLATGSAVPRRLGIPGEELEGVVTALEFLRALDLGPRALNLPGKRVCVIGGGNVAMDCAKSAIRHGAREVLVIYRRKREHMPAYSFEVDDAEREGVRLLFQRTPVEFKGEGQVGQMALAHVQLGERDESGRERPRADLSNIEEIEVDIAVTAIGFETDQLFAEDGIETHEDGRLKADPVTLSTNIPGIFAGGDCVTGPFMVANAIGLGKRAAYHIHEHLFGKTPEDLELTRNTGASQKTRWPRVKRPLDPGNLSEKEAMEAAASCLDCAVCSSCLECKGACPADAIDLSMRPEKYGIDAKSVLIATGFNLFDPSKKPLYGYSDFPNVITAMQMDRLLSPTRPYNAVLRPGDGKVPGNIAIVLCTGSRDQSAGNPWCSRICCMYSIKQAQLIMGAIPIADITVYYIDIRAFGKGYEEFFRQAAAMGVNFIKGKVARIDETDNQDLMVYFEDMERKGGMRRARHDLVVLATGALANPKIRERVKGVEPLLDRLGFFREVDPVREPCCTNVQGLFVAGAASGPRDIPDSVLHAGAAAAQIAAHIRSLERA